MIGITKDIKLIDKKNLFSRIFSAIKIINFEALIWIVALIYLALVINPYHSHFTICPLANAGFEYCPGCGLGNSIALIFNGDFSRSFSSHILGLPALIIIIYRIFSIIKLNLKKEPNHKQ